jgi:hypothetical protein
MSTTEIYGITKNSAFELGETRNSHRGAMAIWIYVEDKYLPPYVPGWAIRLNRQDGKYSRTVQSFGDNENSIEEIWQLRNSEKISPIDNIVLGSTFDNVLVKIENIDKLCDAFVSFEGETSLKEQIPIIKSAKEDESIIAIGWNQTSVNSDTWANYKYDEEKDESIAYNMEIDDKHWFLFDSIK